MGFLKRIDSIFWMSLLKFKAFGDVIELFDAVAVKTVADLLQEKFGLGVGA